MLVIVSNLVLHQVIAFSLCSSMNMELRWSGTDLTSVIRKVKKMYHIRFLFQDGLPAETHDIAQTQCLMVFFPSVSDEDRVSLRKRFILELCSRVNHLLQKDIWVKDRPGDGVYLC